MSSRKIEDVLLQISQVKYKKNDGTLYVMKERIVFMVDGKDDRVSVSHNYQDIKSKS
jgi:transcription initiation factor TFIIH subunit 1